jgi:carboxyl-terminal processing protease
MSRVSERPKSGAMSKGFKRSIFGVSAVLVLFVFLGGLGLRGVRANSQNDDGAYRQMGVYEEVLKKVQSDYVIEPSIDKVTDGALHGLLEGLDADSSYLSPAEYTIYKQQRDSATKDSSGVTGLNVSKRFGYATVVSVIPGSPADKQQIEDGDIIELIEGQSTREMSVALIQLLLDGKPGTSVTFSLVRPRKAEPDKITLTRVKAADEIPALGEQEYEGSSILYLKPVVLTRSRVDEVLNKLKAAPKNRKVLLDLRDVAEGEDPQAIRLANAFLESGTIATLQGQKFPEQIFSAQKADFVTAAPLVVLVNHGTAGAGELIAGAVLDSKRGDVVGDRTFGDGAVQKTIELPDGAALILSVAKYATPGGKKIQDEAVTPNVVVVPSLEEQIAAQSEEKPAGPPAPDDQLNRALALLKAKNG